MIYVPMFHVLFHGISIFHVPTIHGISMFHMLDVPFHTPFPWHVYVSMIGVRTILPSCRYAIIKNPKSILLWNFCNFQGKNIFSFPFKKNTFIWGQGLLIAFRTRKTNKNNNPIL
jgi:hypothetical protein